MLLFLVGYMGCGKSSLGRKAARRLGVEFIDTDAVVERDEGASVADIFCYEGEGVFPPRRARGLGSVSWRAAAMPWSRRAAGCRSGTTTWLL